MRIQRQYNSTLFLPKLSLDFSVLQTGFFPTKVSDPQFIRDNHKIQISFVFFAISIGGKAGGFVALDDALQEQESFLETLSYHKPATILWLLSSPDRPYFLP